MSEMKSAVGAGMDRSGDDLCVENSVREFKIWADVLNYGKKILKNAGIVEADLDAWYLFEQIFGISRAQYFLCARENIAGNTAQKMAAQEQTGNSLESKNALDCVELWLKEKLSAYENTLEKRASRIPLQQILGQQEFMGLTFFVNEHVLIPRQDTETLVELVLNEQKDKNISILDMCTGSGCIAVSLKKLGGYACVEGADISEEALKVAKRNSEEILENSDVNNDAVSSRTEQIQNCTNLTNNQNKQDNSEDRMVSEVRTMPQTGVTFRRSDMFSAFPETERFNVIVSNPPYIPTDVMRSLPHEVKDFEPDLALEGGAVGLDIFRRLLIAAPYMLRAGGLFACELYEGALDAAAELCRQAGLSDVRIVHDLTDRPRIVRAIVTEPKQRI